MKEITLDIFSVIKEDMAICAMDATLIVSEIIQYCNNKKNIIHLDFSGVDIVSSIFSVALFYELYDNFGIEFVNNNIFIKRAFGINLEILNESKDFYEAFVQIRAKN